MKRNKLTPQRAKDLVYVYNNLQLPSRRSQNYNEGESKMRDIIRDGFDSKDMGGGGGGGWGGGGGRWGFVALLGWGMGFCCFAWVASCTKVR